MKKLIVLSLSSILFITWAFASSGIPKIPKPVTGPTVIEKPHNTTNPTKGLIILGDNYAVDENFVYVVNDTRSGWVKMPTADRVTFKVLAGQFARDIDQIFQMGKKIEGADALSFSVISGQYGYAQDKNHIYGPHGIITEADVDTFKMLTKNYSMDAGHVFFDGKNIPEANAGSFEVIESGLYAVDDKSVFYAGKILKNTSPEGFTVKGPRAFTADGRTFFEWLVEKGDLPNDDTDTSGWAGETPDDTGVAPTGFFAQYMSHFTGENLSFWILISLAYLGVFSFLFVFFADRNEEVAPFWKTLLKSLIAIVIGIVAFWLVSFFASELTAQIVGVIIGLFMFMAFWSTLGWIKSILITILTLIAFIFLLSVGGMVVRVIFHDLAHFLNFLDSPSIRMIGIMKIIGICIGSWLIITQLGSSLFRAVGQAIVATVISVSLLAFLFWLGSMSNLVSVLLFTIIYAVILWIMRFRMVSNLFAETVRIVRIALILWVIVGIVMWIVL